MSPTSVNALPNARRVATARAALSTAIAVRADMPVISDIAVTDLLADLRHFCAARHIDFASCNATAEAHYDAEISGGRS